jgi:hypothetical protein
MQVQIKGVDRISYPFSLFLNFNFDVRQPGHMKTLESQLMRLLL